MNLGPCTVLGTFANIMSSNLIITIFGKNLNHFTDKEIEAQRGDLFMFKQLVSSKTETQTPLNSKPSTLSKTPYAPN